MAKSTTTPSKKLPTPSSTPTGAADEAKSYRDDPAARFAPYDNLWEAIRADVAPLGGVELEPLRRLLDEELCFSELDEDWFDDENYKEE